MFKKFLSACVFVSTFVSISACSEDKNTAAEPVSENVAVIEQDVKSPLFENQALMMKLRMIMRTDIISIKESPMPGLYEVQTEVGLAYISEDGEFLIQGDLYGIGSTFQNYTENTLVKLRLEGIEKFEKDLIVYPAKNEKYVVNVFTDITCGYCRKLHALMDEYNDLGITIRYLAYPRHGIQDRNGDYTQSFKDLRSIWCHENPAEALTKAKSGSGVAQRICEAKIAEQLSFGRQAGVTGTPALLFSDGSLVSGFIPPETLLQKLQAAGL